MFPHTNHGPTLVDKAAVRVVIPLAVPRELCAPPLRVSAWVGRVFGTGMPEAPVNEDDNPRSRKNDVRTSPAVEFERTLHAEAISPPVQFGSKRDLWPRMCARSAAHSL